MTVPAPEVDVCIAAHDPHRPLTRAISSVLNHTTVTTRVTIVAHNTERRSILDALGTLGEHPAVRVLELHDNIRSAAGPFNIALARATATFTSVMGSDDSLEPHAIDEWVRIAHRDGADAVIARVAHASGNPIATPPTRPGRTRKLDGVRDRLSYRSAPLGLVRRSAFPSLRFAEGMPVGEDVSYVTALWFSGANISYARNQPAYLVHADAAERTTHSARPVIDELRFAHRLLDSPTFTGLTCFEQSAVAVKLMRIHVFGVILNRRDHAWWSLHERQSLADITSRLLTISGVADVLSRNDHRLIAAIENPSGPVDDLFAASAARRVFATPSSLVSRRFSRILAREAPVRYSIATLLQGLR